MPKKSTIRLDGLKPCTKCGGIKPVDGFYTTGIKVDGSAKYNSWCKSCSKTKMSSYHKNTYGPEKLSHSAHIRTRSVKAYMQYLLAKARRRLGASIDASYLEQLWEKQQGRCALTGWNMTMKLGEGVVPTNASIDRINSSLGYVEGNVQLLCRAANVAKSDLETELFLAMCAAVSEKANDLQNASMAA
jgi:hypothetical protein